jgi:methyl coenzyme M reductase alpha subunit
MKLYQAVRIAEKVQRLCQTATVLRYSTLHILFSISTMSLTSTEHTDIAATNEKRMKIEIHTRKEERLAMKNGTAP